MTTPIEPRRFYLQRVEDESGISGTGRVADGVVFEDGHAVIRWRTATSSTACYDSVADVEAIHGHNGKTYIVWVDEHRGKPLVDSGQEPDESWVECPACFGTTHAPNGFGCPTCNALGRVPPSKPEGVPEDLGPDQDDVAYTRGDVDQMVGGEPADEPTT